MGSSRSRLQPLPQAIEASRIISHRCNRVAKAKSQPLFYTVTTSAWTEQIKVEDEPYQKVPMKPSRKEHIQHNRRKEHTGTYRTEKAQRANTKGRSLKSTLVEAPPPAVAGESSRWRSPNPRLPSKPHLWRRSNTHQRHMPPTRGETASPFNCIWLVVKVVLKPSSTVKEQRGLPMSASHPERGQEMRPTEAVKPSERRQVRHMSTSERSTATITGKYVSNPWPLVFPAKTEQTEKKADKRRKEREPLWMYKLGKKISSFLKLYHETWWQIYT